MDLYRLLKEYRAIGGMDQTGQAGFCLLMALWQKSNGLGWSSRFTMTNTELLLTAGFNTEKHLFEVRNKLAQTGYFFEYETAGKGKKKPGIYTIYFNILERYQLKMAQVNKETQLTYGVLSGELERLQLTSRELSGELSGDLSGELSGVLSGKHYITIPDHTIPDEEAAAAAPAPTRDVIAVFSKEFGRELTPLETETVDGWLKVYGNALVAEAVNRAAMRGKSSNLGYMAGILQDWAEKGIQTRADLEVKDPPLKLIQGRKKERDKYEDVYLT